MEIQKEYNLRYLLAKVCILHEEKRRTGSDNGRTNATKTLLDVFRHRSGTGKSYCRTRFDVGSKRVNISEVFFLHDVSFLPPSINLRFHMNFNNLVPRSAVGLKECL
jgi:hypothetical protein